jgi:hypothetical protein
LAQTLSLGFLCNRNRRSESRCFGSRRLIVMSVVAAQLIAGEYFVQVRHYNRASGMGKYSIKVVKS